MARQLRIEYAGAYYHVLSRGNNLNDIFLSDDDRNDFLEILAEMSMRFDIEIYGYVLMNNHYHLLLRTLKPNLSKSMQWLGTRYTRSFNIRNERSGHLFQGRFKSIIVENGAYLMQLSCYIHRNPLRAGVVDRLTKYKWSSYNYYAYHTKRPPRWLKTSLLFSQLKAIKDKHRAYRNKVQTYSEEGGTVWDDVRYGLIYGSHEFLSHIRDSYLNGTRNKELPQLNQLLRDEDPNQLIEKAAAVLDCDINHFRESGRITGEARDKRDAILYLLWETGKYSNQEVGELMGLTYSSVSRRAYHIKTLIKSRQSSNAKKMVIRLKTKMKQ
jgi:REP element-mobilizing transposase RayT